MTSKSINALCKNSTKHFGENGFKMAPYQHVFIALAHLGNLILLKQVKLGFTRACRSIEELGIKWLKSR